MAGRHDPVRRVGQQQRRHEPLGEQRDGLAGAGLEGAATRPDERPARALEQLERAGEMLLVGPRQRGGRREVAAAVVLAGRLQQVGRDLDVDGPRRRRQRHARSRRNDRTGVLAAS